MTNAQRWIEQALYPAAAVAVFGFWTVTQAGSHQWAAGGRAADLAWYLSLLVVAAIIAAAGRYPRSALGLLAGLLLVQALYVPARFGGNNWPVYLTLLVAVFGLGARLQGKQRRAGLAVVILAAAGTAALLTTGGQITDYWPIDLTDGGRPGGELINAVAVGAATLVFTLGAWYLGAGLRAWQGRHQDAELLSNMTSQRDEAQRELAAAKERDRIAQDLHDIVANSLAVIIAQADGARFISASQSPAAEKSLAIIADSARSSLSEVRILIETLVGDDLPDQPSGMQQTPQLFDRFRAAGLQVDVVVRGETAPLSRAADIALFRILQESLANALKHGGEKPHARVLLDSRSSGVAMSVTSWSRAGNIVTDAAPYSTGRGIYGMTERARLAGGWLSAGPDDSGEASFLVTGFIPADETRDAAYAGTNR